MSISTHKKKYLCISNGKIKPQWLPRWYEIPYDECIFATDDITENARPYTRKALASLNLIKLYALPKGSNYKQHLKELKTERLLDGTDIR
jgi:hypothetical protein